MSASPITNFQARTDYSNSVLEKVRNEMRKLDTYNEMACVYATGSMARGEASNGSDLDLFIIDTADEARAEIRLTDIEATLLRADLIRATKNIGLPAFSGDGMYLQVHRVSEMTRNTGNRTDDSSNSFTARLLLMLESQHLLNEVAHIKARDAVINSYWRDFEENPKAFLPVFLANDIMRFWKTLCVNYEIDRYTPPPTGKNSETWKNSNRLKDIKLKFSRKWICQSALIYLLWTSSTKGTVSRSDAAKMISLTPHERLILVSQDAKKQPLVSQALELYEWFLITLPNGKSAASQWLGDPNNWHLARDKGSEFGKVTFDLLESFKNETDLYRYLIG